jgi:hypothetical protein
MAQRFWGGGGKKKGWVFTGRMKRSFSATYKEIARGWGDETISGKIFRMGEPYEVVER